MKMKKKNASILYIFGIKNRIKKENSLKTIKKVSGITFESILLGWKIG
jgi:hypothetical protein